MYSVYKHTNLTNGKVYIGVTRQKPSRRWRGGQGYRDQPLFWNAILKYGWDGFSHEILERKITEQAIHEAEINYIKHFRSADRLYGYNIANGGVGSEKFSIIYRKNLSTARKARPPHSEETKKKIGEALRGKVVIKSEKWRENLSKSLTGRKLSEEHCLRISEAKKGSQFGKKNPKARAVVCIDTNEVYDCIIDAANDTGCDRHNITSVCKGRLKTCGGYRWKYQEGRDDGNAASF